MPKNKKKSEDNEEIENETSTEPDSEEIEDGAEPTNKEVSDLTKKVEKKVEKAAKKVDPEKVQNIVETLDSAKGASSNEEVLAHLKALDKKLDTLFERLAEKSATEPDKAAPSNGKDDTEPTVPKKQNKEAKPWYEREIF